jgi:hypothetical protein
MIFAVFLGFIAHAQSEYNITVQKGSSYTISLTLEYDMLIVKDWPVVGNELDITNVGDLYTVVYTPAASFVGSDGFKLQDLRPMTGQSSDHIVLVEVVESKVELEDDFIRLTTEEEVTFDPTSNDESTASDLTIEVAHVMNGSAIVNDDNTITYTPAEDMEADYILYSGKDMYGSASTATVYVTSDGEEETEDSYEDIDMHSGSVQYITLPDTNYSFQDSILEYGKLTQMNDYVWKYTALENVNGVDELFFSNDAGLDHTVSINVIENYIDTGFVKDDIFFSAKNTQMVFNVKENDLNGQTVIESYSDELIHLGDGTFVFTPDAGSAGIYEFEYEANTGSDIESGTIKLVVGNFTPSASVDYTLTTPKNQPRVIEYEVPLGTEFFEIEGYPSHGSVEVFGPDETIDLSCEEGMQKVFAVYTPNEDYVGADDIVLRYFASDNNLPTYSSVVIVTEESDVTDACICVDNCVWPGDANGDGNVNVRDLLTIGRYMGATGEQRAASPFGDTYEGVQVPSWSGNQINGKSIGFADSNGDGIVSTADIDEVEDNYGEVNTLVSDDLFGVKDIPFYLVSGPDAEVGEVKEIKIYAGNSSYPAIDMRGIAFSINLPEANVDASSIELQFVEDDFFAKGAPFSSLVHISDDLVVEAAGVKTNGVGSTGSGLIAVLTFIVIEDAEGIKPQGRSAAYNTNSFSVEMNNIVYEANDGLQYSIPNTSINFEVDNKDNTSEIDLTDISLRPNPAMNDLQISSKADNNISNVGIYNITGEQVIRVRNVNKSAERIDVSRLEAGMYIINVTTTEGTESKKFIKG